MTTNEEKNFEDGGEDAQGVKIELAKAGSAATPKISTSTPRSKSAARNDRDDDDGPEGQLTIDVYQTPTEIIVESAVAGVEPDDLDINVTSDSITVKGRRHREQEIKEENYFYQECYWGRFSRSVILPQEVDADAAYASFKNGILTVHLPKLNRQKNKKIKISLG